MTFTYDTSLASDRDLVRLYIGDTNAASPLFSDEEINAMITREGSALLAAAALADSLAGKFSRSVSFSVEGLSISNSIKAENYRLLASRLRSQAAGGTAAATPFVGGVSQSEMDSVESDTDRPPSRIRVGQDDYPGSVSDAKPRW